MSKEVFVLDDKTAREIVRAVKRVKRTPLPRDLSPVPAAPRTPLVAVLRITSTSPANAATAVTLAADQTDWTPGTDRGYKLNVTAAGVHIRSVVYPIGTYPTLIFYVLPTSVNGVTVTHLDAAGTSQYRVNCPGGVDYVAAVGTTFSLSYDGANLRWNLTANPPLLYPAKIQEYNSDTAVWADSTVLDPVYFEDTNNVVPVLGSLIALEVNYDFVLDGAVFAAANSASTGTDTDWTRQSFSNADYAVTAATNPLVVGQTGTLTAARTVTLPRATTAGQVVIIVDESGSATATNKLTPAGSGGDTVNGGTAPAITVGYGMLICTADGTSKWTAELSLPSYSSFDATHVSGQVVVGIGLPGDTSYDRFVYAVPLLKLTALAADPNHNFAAFIDTTNDIMGRFESTTSGASYEAKLCHSSGSPNYALQASDPTGDIVRICDNTYGVDSNADIRCNGGTSTFHWQATGSVNTHLVAVSTTVAYGSIDGTPLTTPDAWAVIRINGTNYKIPAYL
jgi:hypothetical protein